MSVRRKDPWTDPDPQPGDFDEDIAAMRPEHVQHFEGHPGGKVVFIDTDDVDGWLRKRRAERVKQARERSVSAATKSQR